MMARMAEDIGDALPPEPGQPTTRQRQFERWFRVGVALAVAGVVVPQYAYLFTAYVHGPTDWVLRSVVDPADHAGVIVVLLLLAAAPFKLGMTVAAHARERRDRLLRGATRSDAMTDGAHCDGDMPGTTPPSAATTRLP